MLAFDLETSGLDISCAHIMCASVYDPDAGISQVFMFCMGDSVDEFLDLLDHADRLCAFNGARFDIPMIQQYFQVLFGFYLFLFQTTLTCFRQVENSRVSKWRLKLHDVFEACKLALDCTFSLDTLLALNGLPTKSGSGIEALQMIRTHDWERLRHYSIRDAELTYLVSMLDKIKIPRVNGIYLTNKGEFVRETIPKFNHV